jgi:hypothetical protein
MPTKFDIIRGPIAESDRLAQEANEAMAVIEEAGGRFVESHWSVTGPTSTSSQVLATLVIVYEVGPSDEEVAEGNAALDAYYRNEGLSPTGENST